MSYILEALKKSEQERGHGSAPGVQTVHSSNMSYQSHKRSLWPWILIAAVFLNVGVLLFFIFNTQAVTPDMASDPTVFNPEPSPTRVIQRHPRPAPQQTVIPPPAPVTNELKTSDVTPSLSAKYNSATSFSASDITQLPEEIRRHIPDIKFSAHVYSSNPVQRSVVINGRYMEEGENLNDDFFLAEITTTGVIMSFRGYLYHANVITGW